MTISLIINGLTIALEEGLEVVYNNNGLFVRKATKPQMIITPELVRQVIHDKPLRPLSIEQSQMKKEREVLGKEFNKLPSNIEKMITDHLKQHDGRSYSIGITKAIFTSRGVQANYPRAKQLRVFLEKMMTEGTLTLLSGNDTPRIYGLSSMMEKKPEDERNPIEVNS